MDQFRSFGKPYRMHHLTELHIWPGFCRNPICRKIPFVVYPQVMADLLAGFPLDAPAKPTRKLRYADVAVTATANEFAGIYRGKQYHPADFDAMLDRAAAAGVEKVMLTGMSLADVPTNLAIAAARPTGQSFVTIGVHPYHAAEPDAETDYFKRLFAAVRDALQLNPSPLAAYGELGLDYDRINRAPKETQLRCFRTQLDLYIEHKLDLPLFLHCRGAAFDDFVTTLTPYLEHLPAPPRRGLVHSFVGTATQMRVLVDLGLGVSVNGFSFKDTDSLDMVREVPLNRLQIETDAPWGDISPNTGVGKRYLKHAVSITLPTKKCDKFQPGFLVKERNESCCIDRVAYIVAGLRGETVEQVAEAAWTNSTTMFGLT